MYNTIIITATYPPPKLAWNTGRTTSDSNGAQSLLFQTTDGLHSYSFATSSKLVSLNNEMYDSPNGTTLTITVRYPFQSINTNLAFKIVASSQDTNGLIDPKLDIGNHHVYYGNTYWNWEKVASTSRGSVNAVIVPAEECDVSNFATTLVSMLTNTISTSNLGVGRVYYASFKATSADKYVTWSTTVAIGKKRQMLNTFY